MREAVRAENVPVAIHVAHDGEEAVNFIERAENDSTAPAPEILVLDLNLPKQDGFEVLARLRASERFRYIPVIVVTSSDSPEDRRRAANFGAAYFRKPPSYDQFMRLGAVLKEILSR